MTNFKSTDYDEFRYVPVLTVSDFWEAGRIAHALTEFGVSACAVGGEVVVTYEGVAAADDAVARLRRERTDVDWSKVQIDWAKRISLRDEL